MKSFDELMRIDPTSNYCVFGYNTSNLGDYVQVLAILQHITPACFVLRDNIEAQPDLTLVANAWLTAGELPRKDDFRARVFAGVHLHPPLRTPEALESFIDAGTVGCRDVETFRFMRQHNVPAVLTRCPTLTFPTYHGPRERMVFVDVDDKTVSRFTRKHGARGDFVSMTHETNTPLSDSCLSDGTFASRMREAYEALLLYRSARLVMTARLHVALPCLAFGTPVIYTGPQDARSGAFHNLPLHTDIEAYRWYRYFLPVTPRLPRAIDCEPEKEFFRYFLGKELMRASGAQHMADVADLVE